MTAFLILVSQSLYFMLPAYVANMMPVIASRVHFLEKPISLNKLGAHKTWRGFCFGSLGAIVSIFIQVIFSPYTSMYGLDLLQYGELGGDDTGAIIFGSVFIGALFGGGALLGDALKSFFKRKIGIAPGSSLPVIDQIDYVIGALVFTYPFFAPPIENIITILIISPVLTMAANIISFKLHLKKVWW